ncbi:hypothetical protein CYFUS_000808 [Cystobacter fuscus]|uniref:Uncharacterized protein n=1 Tax=Cystobacter fuscus TaxID=43 RepID=A0A250IUG0_9BACT|nr:hypothetical protein CYFUS_000808 [Cystobacter fuscus]
MRLSKRFDTGVIRRSEDREFTFDGLGKFDVRQNEDGGPLNHADNGDALEPSNQGVEGTSAHTRRPTVMSRRVRSGSSRLATRAEPAAK